MLTHVKMVLLNKHGNMFHMCKFSISKSHFHISHSMCKRRTAPEVKCKLNRRALGAPSGDLNRRKDAFAPVCLYGIMGPCFSLIITIGWAGYKKKGGN